MNETRNEKFLRDDFDSLVDIASKYGFNKVSEDTIRILDVDSDKVLDLTLTPKEVVIKLSDDTVTNIERTKNGVFTAYLFLHGKTVCDITEVETDEKTAKKDTTILAQKSNNRAYCYVMTADLILAMSAEGYFGDEAMLSTFTA